MFLELLDSYNVTLVCFIMRKQGVASLLLLFIMIKEKYSYLLNLEK